MSEETLYELNAALDHIARHWSYAETEAEVVDRAYGHLKRSCLDVFKVRLKEAGQQYEELRTRTDTSILDNGEFDRNLRKLWATIKEGAIEARRLEGDTRNDSQGKIQAFDRWQPVFVDCLKLEQDFYLHPSLEWARRKGIQAWLHQHLAALVVGVVAGILSTVLVMLIFGGS